MMVQPPPPVRAFLLRYSRFLVVGGVVGVLCVLLREILALALLKDSAAGYSASVFLVYLFGISLSYVLQRRYVFADRRLAVSPWRRLVFVASAAASAICASGLSALIRYGAGLDAILGPLAPALAMISAAMLVSIANFYFASQHVFLGPAAEKSTHPSTGPETPAGGKSSSGTDRCRPA